jgi:NADH dehydrogenase
MILLLGATGLMGGSLLRQLTARKIPVRAFTRGSNDWKKTSVSQFKREGVELVIADVTDRERLVRAMDGCTAVVNLIGVFQQQPGSTFALAHVQATQAIIESAREVGIQRLMHMSCLGASEGSPSEYLRTKWQGEQLVKGAELYWTIYRPSFMFGETFPLLEWLSPFLRFPLIMPFVGSGLNEIEPVFVDEVVNYLIDSIYDKASVGKVFELGGPEIYTMSDFMSLARSKLRLKGPTIEISPLAVEVLLKPFALTGSKAAQILELLPLLRAQSVCSDNILESCSGYNPVSIEECLTKIMSRS